MADTVKFTIKVPAMLITDDNEGISLDDENMVIPSYYDLRGAIRYQLSHDLSDEELFDYLKIKLTNRHRKCIDRAIENGIITRRNKEDRTN